MLLRQNIIDEIGYLKQAVWCGYVLPRLADGLGIDLNNESFGQMAVEGG